MRKITFQGFIKKSSFAGFDTIELVQQDGYLINLINRLIEAANTYGNDNVQFNYYLSNKYCSRSEMVEGWLKKISGSCDIDYSANSYYYSTMTGGGTDLDTSFIVGGHNLLYELNEHEGMFIIIDVNFGNL